MIAGGDGAVQGEHVEHIGVDESAKPAQGLQAHVGQIEVLSQAHRDRLAHHLVGVAKRQALAHQVVGEIGRRGKARPRGLAQALGVGLHMRHHVGEGAQAIAHRIHAVEQRFFVFLIVLVVGQGLAFHQGQQRDEMTVDAAGLAAHQFGHVGVFLLRHDGRAGAETIRKLHKPKRRAGPQHQFFAHPRQVGEQQRGEGAELNGEIAIGDGIQGVSRRLRKSQAARRVLAIDGKAGAGQGRRAQGAFVHARPAVAQAAVVALQHFVPGQHVVAEGHRLGALQVGESGHHGGRMCLGQPDQRELEPLQLTGDAIDGIAQVEADVGGDLIVARTARMQFLARLAAQRGEPRFDVHVHVFEFYAPGELARGDLRLDGGQTGFDTRQFPGAEHADGGQHARVGEGGANILRRQAPIEADGSRKALHETVRGLFESPAPEAGFALVAGHICPVLVQ